MRAEPKKRRVRERKALHRRMEEHARRKARTNAGLSYWTDGNDRAFNFHLQNHQKSSFPKRLSVDANALCFSCIFCDMQNTFLLPIFALYQEPKSGNQAQLRVCCYCAPSSAVCTGVSAFGDVTLEMLALVAAAADAHDKVSRLAKPASPGRTEVSRFTTGAHWYSREKFFAHPATGHPRHFHQGVFSIKASLPLRCCTALLSHFPFAHGNSHHKLRRIAQAMYHGCGRVGWDCE